MEESIYNLIPQPVPVPEKPPMYRSKHSGICPPTYSTFGLTGTSKPGFANMGGNTAAQGEGQLEGPHASPPPVGAARSAPRKRPPCSGLIMRT